MKERPILFNGDMVRAILSGRKTQTRRVMKVQPSANFSPMNMALELDYNARWYHPGIVDKDGYLQPAKKLVFGVADEDEGYACPIGAVGDRLWVRETFNAHWLGDDQIQDIKDGTALASELCDFRANYPDNSKAAEGWTPSIHMPRWASRILLEITSVRIEHLNEISEEDAEAEGLERENFTGFGEESGIPHYPEPDVFRGTKSSDWTECPSEAFKDLWQSIYGADSWQANPWVWVIQFKLVEKTQ